MKKFFGRNYAAYLGSDGGAKSKIIFCTAVRVFFGAFSNPGEFL
jgi:hypothetical protein